MSDRETDNVGITYDDVFADMGNISYIGTYISYFESQIEVRNEENSYLSDCPNYYAWLLITSEHLYYRVKRLLFFKNKDHSIFNKPYKETLDMLFEDDEYKTKINDDTKKNIELFAQIRHLLIHKYFPNPLKATTCDERKLTSEIKYTKEDVWSVCKRLRSPKEYSSLRKSFYDAIRALEKMDKEMEIDLGGITYIRVKKSRELDR